MATFTCPSCGKEFKAYENMSFYIGKNPACSKECWLKYVKEKDKEKGIEIKKYTKVDIFKDMFKKGSK